MPINWFGETINIPPVLWGVLIAVIIAAAFLIVKSRGKKFAANTFVCPNCENRFKPKWYNLLTFHAGGEYMLKCLKCGKRDLCSVSYEQNDNS